MRAYTFALGKLMEGIAVTHDLNLKSDVVVLGETGEKSIVKKVSLDRLRPAIATNNVIRHAHLKPIMDGRYHVLAQPLRDESKSALVRVNCRSINPNNKLSGSWAIWSGNPKAKITANGRRVSGAVFCDDLVVIGPDEAILVYPEGNKEGFELFNKPGVGLKVKPIEQLATPETKDTIGNQK